MADVTTYTARLTWEELKTRILIFINNSRVPLLRSDIITHVVDDLQFSAVDADKALQELEIQGEVDRTRSIEP